MTKKKIVKRGACQYHLCDKKRVELFKCEFCGEYFCKEHSHARIPMSAPFKTTDVEEAIEWKKKVDIPALLI